MYKTNITDTSQEVTNLDKNSKCLRPFTKNAVLKNAASLVMASIQLQ